MVRDTQILSRWLAAAMAATALAAPATSAGYYDLRNPDDREPAIDSKRQPGYQTFRNPDTRDAASTAQGGGVREPVISKSEPGFDWGDAGIGAGSVLGVVLIALSVMFAVVHRKSRSAEAEEGSAVTS